MPPRDRKPSSKPEPPKGHTLETFTADAFVVIFGLFILSALLARLALVFGGRANGGILGILNLGWLALWFQRSVYPVMEIVAVILSILFLWGIIYSVKKLNELNKLIHIKYSRPVEAPSTVAIQNIPQQKINFSKQWSEILKHASSNSVNDWKVAILDADSMLDDCLIAKNYQGETMGDRLKSVNPADMKTLDMAWEAHKFRNGIAHGSDISFNQHEVRRVVSLFEKVFRELQVI